jgi:hypothetical protein
MDEYETAFKSGCLPGLIPENELAERFSTTAD